MAKAKDKDTGLAPAKPAFLAKEDQVGFEKMEARDIVFPRLRICQPSSPLAVDGKMTPGQVYEDVSNTMILDKDEAVEFAIAFWFKSWIEWGDIDDGEGPIEISSDPSSELAMRAAKREMKDTAKGPKMAVTEYHNFIVMLESDPGKLYHIPCFRTSHKHGRQLLNMARMREASIFAGKYLMSSVKRQKDTFTWFEFAFENAGWVTQEQHDWLSEQHATLHQAHEASRIDFVVDEGAAGSDEEETEY